jgi:lipoprotein-anchoring transpeptidase ErfK/SrfK
MHEPARIGPGPRNPLGTRALNLSAPGIRIHGTPAARSIGYSVSHGCIRMRMPDVEALYPLVPQAAPVFIVRAGPPRFPGSAPAVPDTANVADGG